MEQIQHLYVLRESRVWSHRAKGFNSGWVLRAWRSNVASCYPMQPWGLGCSYQCVEGYEDPPHYAQEKTVYYHVALSVAHVAILTLLENFS